MSNWRNKQMRDRRGAGGNIADGYRVVRKGGRVKFDRFTYQHGKLIPLVGDIVYVSDAEDIFYSSKIGIFSLDHESICYARNEYENGGTNEKRK